jgi:hypothetical protein
MNVAAFLIVGALAIITLGVVGWFLTAKKVPERAGEPDRSETVTTTDRLAKDTFAPADPGAEVMDPDLLGGDGSPPTD